MRNEYLRTSDGLFGALGHRIGQFARSEDGVVATDFAFMTAAMVASGISVIQTVSGGVENISTDVASHLAAEDIIFASRNFGRNRLEALLVDEDITTFSDAAITSRYNRFMDERTEAQVRNAHRTWVRRMNNPDYSNPARAADMVAILESVMEARSVEPHTNI